MNIKKILPTGEVRQLKTDDEVLVEAVTSLDRIRAVKALMKAKCVLKTPEMLEIISEIARFDVSSKTRFEAAKYIIDRGLGTPDKELPITTKKVEEMVTNEQLENALSGSNEDIS